MSNFLSYQRGLYNASIKKGKVFPLQAQLWPRGWVEV